MLNVVCQVSITAQLPSTTKLMMILPSTSSSSKEDEAKKLANWKSSSIHTDSASVSVTIQVNNSSLSVSGIHSYKAHYHKMILC